ncbi:glycosyltransferase [Variovorax sp. GT1P44]|uniref:glycosyltransferase n=1 Tax=Variovorax sp. GT1P44 TaxID=3443742 RepID=UPI003F454360
MRVLYFTVVPLAAPGNGGSICCRNHVERLSADLGIDLFAMTAGPLAWKSGTDAFFAGLKVQHHFQPFKEGNVHHESNGIRSIARFAWSAVFQLPWEMQALNQEHIEEGIAWAVRVYSIDVIVIDYHPSTLFLRLPRSDARTALISLNREGDFYGDLIRVGNTHHGRLTARVSLARANRWVRRVDASVDQLIAIGPPDLPRHPTRRPPVCITPYLDPKRNRWAYAGTKRLFFVGAYGHYPNRLAIEWLTREFAPALRAIGSDGLVTIIGASAAEVPDAPSNVQLLGLADRDEVERQFCTCALMLCPVENDYGVKFKALEALSYGAPLLASRETMLGLPHLSENPSFDLRNPAGAASQVAELLASRDRIEALSAAQQRQQTTFIASQTNVWSAALWPLSRSATMQLKGARRLLQFFRRARRLENPDEATGAPVSVAPVKTLTREDVTSIYLQVLRRPPESEATVELHFSAHNTPEGFRASLMQSDEYRLLSTFSSGRKV